MTWYLTRRAGPATVPRHRPRHGLAVGSARPGHDPNRVASCLGLWPSIAGSFCDAGAKVALAPPVWVMPFHE
uniref:Uncharacterized protein n=1 Tax=Oryza barthii TaxID=65489 RepID=A0A0D3GN24_9ORYZ